LLIFVFLKFKIDGALRAFYGANPRKISDLVGIVDYFIFKLFFSDIIDVRCICIECVTRAILKACALYLL